MSVTIIVLLVIAAGVAGLLVYASTQPDDFRVERSVAINAPQSAIFPHLDGQKAFNVWNPFIEADPAVKLDYNGPSRGVGSNCAWEGNSKVGKGEVEIVEIVSPERVCLRLRMVKPMACDNKVEFTLTPLGAATRVTWAMSGAQPFMGKLMSLFIDCDKMLGRQFDKGLAKLKTMAETLTSVRP